MDLQVKMNKLVIQTIFILLHYQKTFLQVNAFTNFRIISICVTKSNKTEAVANTYASVLRLANLGATMFEKKICFSGGGAPLGALMMTESPERICNSDWHEKSKTCQLTWRGYVSEMCYRVRAALD